MGVGALWPVALVLILALTTVGQKAPSAVERASDSDGSLTTEPMSFPAPQAHQSLLTYRRAREACPACGLS